MKFPHKMTSQFSQQEITKQKFQDQTESSVMDILEQQNTSFPCNAQAVTGGEVEGSAVVNPLLCEAKEISLAPTI